MKVWMYRIRFSLLLLLLLFTACVKQARAQNDVTIQSRHSGAFKVAMLFNGRINDGGWDQTGYEGLLLIERELGAQIAYQSNLRGENEMEQSLRHYAAQGFDFIIGHGGRFIDPAAQVAEEFPHVNFAVVASFGGNNRNFGALTTRIGELGYLAGAVSALKSATRKVGFISGLPHSAPQEQALLFERGAKATDVSLEVTVSWVGSWGDPEKAREIAREQIASGIDLIFTDCGGTANPAVIEEAQKAGIYAIGASQAQCDSSPETVIACILLDIPRMLLKGAMLAQQGRWEGKQYKFGLHDGAQDLALSGGIFSPEEETKIQAIRQKIISHKINIEP